MDEHSVYAIPHHAPLPAQIRAATSPRRRPSIRKWPPPSILTVKKFWHFDQHLIQPNQDHKIVSLSSYIAELDKERHRTPDPKRYLLRGEDAPKKVDIAETAEAKSTVRVTREVFPSEKRFSNRAASEEHMRIGDNGATLTSETAEVMKLSKAEELRYEEIVEAKRSEQLPDGLLSNDYDHQYSELSALPTIRMFSIGNQSEKMKFQHAPVPPARKSLSETNRRIASSATKETKDCQKDESHVQDTFMRDTAYGPFFSDTGGLLQILPEPQQHSSSANSSSLLALVNELRERERSWTEKAEIIEEKELASNLGSNRKSEADDTTWPPPFDDQVTELIRKSLILCGGELQSTGKDEPHNMNEKHENIKYADLCQNDQKTVAKDVEKVQTDDVTISNVEECKCIGTTNNDDNQPSRSSEKEEEEETEQSIEEKEDNIQVDQERLYQLRMLNELSSNEQFMQRAHVTRRARLRAVLARQRSEEADRQCEEDLARIELFRQRNIDRLTQISRAILHNDCFGKETITRKRYADLEEALKDSTKQEEENNEYSTLETIRRHTYEILNENEKKHGEEEIRLRDENDKRIAIESIERHQRQLQEQQEQLSQLLDNAIVFLKNLDTDTLKKSPESNAFEGVEESPNTQYNEASTVLKEAERAVKQYDNVSEDYRISSTVEGITESEAVERNAELHKQSAHKFQRWETPAEKIVRAIQKINTIKYGDDMKRNERTGGGTFSNVPRGGNGTESCSRSASENIVNALQNLELRNNCRKSTAQKQEFRVPLLEGEPKCKERGSSTNKFMKTATTTTQQHIHQGDDSARGRGTLQTQGSRVPFCEHCKQQIRGAYVLATGLAWCPEHFVCANKACNRRLLDIGFVEDKGQKYCEQCFENLIAPHCAKCSRPITADCLNALQKQWHPQCFVCAHCHKPFGNSAFFLEQGLPYCEADWNALFTTKCVSCHYPIEAGDRWVEALGSAFHSNCFNCTSCNVNLEGESFYAKNGAPYCKLHA